MKHVAIVFLSFLIIAGCASHRKAVTTESNVITFDMLPPDMQARGRALYGPQVDKEWQRIVDATIKAQPWVGCYCDRGKKGRPCNPTNWSCCGSAVFAPQDASSCATPDPCNCPPPPNPAKWHRHRAISVPLWCLVAITP